MTDANAPRLSPQAQLIKLLQDKLEEAKAGKLSGIVLGLVTQEGASSVQSTGVNVVMLSHLRTLFDRRINQIISRIENAARPAAPGTAPVPTSGTSSKIVPATGAMAKVPRKARRLIAKASKKAAHKSRSPQNGAGVPAALKPS